MEIHFHFALQTRYTLYRPFYLSDSEPENIFYDVMMCYDICDVFYDVYDAFYDVVMCL